MNYTDETIQLRDAISTLETGEMARSELFSLEEAMSSIELMVPKMDSGCDMRKSLIEYNTTREKVCTTLLSEEGECRVADILVGQVFAWLSGQLYIQSVHSSMYVTERENLPCSDLTRFIDQILCLCWNIHHFMGSGAVSDEEDFVSFMFGLNDGAKIKPSVSPQLTSYLMCLRVSFIGTLALLISPKAGEPHDTISLIGELMEIVNKIQASIHPLSEDLGFLDETVDPALHKNLLPSGPPKFVPPVKDSCSIYEDWKCLLMNLKEALQILPSTTCSSPFDLITKLGVLRKVPGFRHPFLRTILYHTVKESFQPAAIVQSWCSTCCGGSLTPFTIESSDELTSFKADLEMVLNQVVFGLFRSPARQHRSLSKVLGNLCILQHRAWDLKTRVDANPKAGFSPSGLWAFTAAVGCLLVQINLLLNIELDLVDINSRELSITLFLLEKVSSVQLFVFNNLLSFAQSGRKGDRTIINSLREQAVVAGIENAFLSHAFSISLIGSGKMLKEEQLGIIFDLRSIPLIAFPLPKSITFADYLRDAGACVSVPDDECLGLIDKGLGLQARKSGPEGVVLGSDINAVKKTVIHNKLMKLKIDNLTDGTRLIHKYHWIVPCIVKNC